jgi:HD-GYP domain-containing protein (c-di-GMP phosphodiesterase class II)/DNA-binding CsgD family transcriptional regulator
LAQVRLAAVQQESSAKDLRLAELLATVSLASDLAHEVPSESALRDAMLAVQLGRLAGWSDQDLSDAYYLALLYHVGCTGAVAIQSRFGAGDDVAVRHWLSEADFANRPELMRISVTRLARQWGPADWARGMAQFMALGQTVPEAFANLAEVAVRLSERLEASQAVTNALRHTYARWDGKVFPGLPSGPDQSKIARLVHLVHVARRYHHLGDRETADGVVSSRRGSEFDPGLADLWLANSHALLRPDVGESVWDEALDAEPEPHRMVWRAHVDEVSGAIADFVDLKSPYTHGHSRRLARLMVSAGQEAGLSEEEVTTLRRAAQVHDLGNVSIPDRVLTKRGSLNPAEWERVRLHAYHSQRIMGVTPVLKACGEIAGIHHERLDESGYHRGLRAAAIPLSARMLIAGEAYQSMTEERSWRAPLTPAQAAAELRREQSDGRLDRLAVDAVLTAAGQPTRGGRAARSWPAGLTNREVDVVRLLARGLSNRQIANTLHVSETTVHTHVINVYGKAGVNTRAGITLFALEQDLIQSPSSKGRPLMYG